MAHEVPAGDRCGACRPDGQTLSSGFDLWVSMRASENAATRRAQR